jgi:hypothetical protein
MADLSDVENALVGMIAGAIYPNGTLASSAIVAGCRIYAGWPQADRLDQDLRLGRDGPDAAKMVNVSVFPQQSERNTTRYTRRWDEMSRAAKTIVATVSGDQVTLSGTISVPAHVSIVANGKAWSYGVQPSDSLASIAAALATLIGPPASSLGAILTIPNAWGLKANVGGWGTLARTLRQQMKQIQIDVWSPTPALRVAAARVIDPLLAEPGFLHYADGTYGRIEYVGANDIDESQKELCYRRTMTYWCEWPTIQTVEAPEITVGEQNIVGSQSGAVEGVPTRETRTGG